jgi:hypothetical protein
METRFPPPFSSVFSIFFFTVMGIMRLSFCQCLKKSAVLCIESEETFKYPTEIIAAASNSLLNVGYVDEPTLKDRL